MNRYLYYNRSYYLFLLPFFFMSVAAQGAFVSLKDLQELSQKEHPENHRFEEYQKKLEGELQATVYLPSPVINYEEMFGTAMGNMRQPRWQFKQSLPFPIKTYWMRESLQKAQKLIGQQKTEAGRVRETQLIIEFQRWVAQHQKLNLLKEQERLLSQLISVQQTRYISQKVTQMELVALQIERGYLLTNLSEAEAELTIQKNKVESLVGRPFSELNLAGKEKDIIPQSQTLQWRPLLKLSREQLKEKIVTFNAEQEAMATDLQKTAAEVAAARWAWVPDFELMASREKDFRDLESSALGIGLEIPIWGGRQTAGALLKAKAENTLAQVNLSESLRQKTLKAEGLIEEQRQLRKQLDLMENGLIQLSNQNVKAARIKYQTGSLPYSDFLALIQTSYRTLINYEDLKVKVVDNQENLRLLLGEDL